MSTSELALNSVGLLIDYILKSKPCTQAALARELSVTRAQVSKWKAGERVSDERRSQLLTLAGLFDTDLIEWALFARTQDNATAWCDYFQRLAEECDCTGSITELIQEQTDFYTSLILCQLIDLGARIDSNAPAIPPSGDPDDEDELEQNALFRVLSSLMESWSHLRAWFDEVLYFEDLTDDVECALFDSISYIEYLLLDLALQRVDPDDLKAISVGPEQVASHIEKTREKAFDLLHSICRTRIKHGLPITEDYFALLELDDESLSAHAEMMGALADHCHPGSILQYLSYGERMLLNRVSQLFNAVTRLETRLESLR